MTSVSSMSTCKLVSEPTALFRYHASMYIWGRRVGVLVWVHVSRCYHARDKNRAAKEIGSRRKLTSEGVDNKK